MTIDTLSIQRSQISEYEPHKFEAEASALRLPPGVWPRQVKVEGPFGNGYPLIAKQALRSWGETVGVIYRQEYGCIELSILND